MFHSAFLQHVFKHVLHIFRFEFLRETHAVGCKAIVSTGLSLQHVLWQKELGGTDLWKISIECLFRNLFDFLDEALVKSLESEIILIKD